MLVFTLMLILEIVLAVWTIKTEGERKKYLKNRLMIRTAQMAVFFLSMLLPGINLDMRFKMLLLVLVILWIYALVLWLAKRKTATGRLSKAKSVAKATLAVVLFAFASVPAFLFTDYEGLETTGQYKVKTAEDIWVDNSRVEEFEQDGSKREVPVHFYYPEVEGDVKEGGFPLIIFSHGAFGYYQSNTSTYMELASRGYVVVSLDHPYHSFYTVDTDGKVITVDPGFMQEVQYVNENNTPETDIFDYSSKWLKLRTDDMNFVIDTIKLAKKKDIHTSEDVMNAIKMADDNNIGLFGHSLGGATSVTVGRQREEVKAVIDLDGTMLGEQIAYENGRYEFNEEPYPIPILAVDTEYHYQAALEYGDLYVNNKVIENAVDGREVYFKDAGHMNFTDLPLFSPVLANKLGTGTIDEVECIKKTNEIVCMFFDHYLKNEGEVVLQEYYE
ncbi:MAG: hypothetical protein PUB19_01855 [Lachnospiraceae bacterium]|nr:hypothetical protein [Lachnospiraceae bacterium]